MNSKLPLISVIVPCYNSGNFLSRTIESVFDQTYENFEIIIVNDGSTDFDTKKLLKFYEKDKRIKVIHQKNKGLSSARNEGIRRSFGSYIYFLDSDDWIDRACLKDLYEKIKHNPNYFSYSSINLIGSKRGKLKKNYNFFEELFTNQIPYSCLYHYSIFSRFGGFDEKMKLGFEDWEMHIRLGSNKIYGLSLNKFYFNYNVSKQGMLQSKSLKNYYQIFKYIRKKHKHVYKLNNLLKIYMEFKKKKSTNNLHLYFLYIIYINILPIKYLNYFLNLILKFSHSKRVEKKYKKKFKRLEVSKILHVITSSDIGGAEKALLTLVKSTPSLTHTIISLKYREKSYVSYPDNVQYYNLAMKPKKINFFQIIKLISLMHRVKFDIIQSWLYHSDFLVSIYYLLSIKKKKILWTIHNNNLDPKILGIYTYFLVILCRILSHKIPFKIIFVSKSAMKKHIDFGYKKEISSFIPPLISEKTTFEYESKKKIFVKNKKKTKQIILGCLARWDIQKNQLFLLDCLYELKQEGFDFILLMAGTKIDKDNKKLNSFIKLKKLEKFVRLLGPIKRIDKFFKNIDLNILPSLGESFPLVIHEAQYYSTPSLASNVGDISQMLKLGGWIFESNNKKSFKIKFKAAYETFLNKDLWKKKCLETNKSFALKIHNNKSLNSYLQLLKTI